MIRRLTAISFAILIMFLLAGICVAESPSYQGGLHTRSMITQSVEQNRLVTLSGNIRPEANAQNDRGRVEDSLPLEHMLLQLQRPPETEKDLVNLIDEMHRPGSPAFHQWMLPAELGEKFGVSQPDMEKITNWLESYGFKINTVFPTGMVIDFSGNAGQVREAFHTEIHNLEVKGEAHIANMRDPQIPAALAGAVKGVVSLNNFMPRPMYKPRPAYTFTSGTTTEYALVPPDLATIYNLNPLFTAGYTGTGQTIVVIEDTDVYSTANWSTFRSEFGLSTYTSGSFTQVHPGGCTDPGVNGAEIEAAL
ncbi:MAG: protease pro-enzyme activation domain-containing protein, partial [Terriglobales bacterium]